MNESPLQAKLVVVVAFVVLVAGGALISLPPGIPGRDTNVAVTQLDCLPETWNVAEIVDAAVANGEMADESYVLVWHTLEDGRPWRVESCIVWLLRVNGQETGEFWELDAVSRTPGNEWSPNFSFYGPISYRRFDHAPSAQETLQFMRDSWWPWDGDEGRTSFGYDFEANDWKEVAGFKLIDGSVCRDTWRKLTGQDFVADVPAAYYK